MKHFFILLLITTTAHAQLATADIQGYVTDSTGQPISGVGVCIKFSGKFRTTHTNLFGFYSLPDILIHEADLYFYHSGYRPQLIKGVYLKDGQVKQVNMLLHNRGHYASFTVYAGKVPLLDWDEYYKLKKYYENDGLTKRKRKQLFRKK